MRILVVEDEKKVANFVKQGLEEEGYAVDWAADGQEGLTLALDGVHDLIVLDLESSQDGRSQGSPGTPESPY